LRCRVSLQLRAGLRQRSATRSNVRRIRGRLYFLQPRSSTWHHRPDHLGSLDKLINSSGGVNVNEQMVKNGDAWAYRQYLKDSDYCAWEVEARDRKKGLWRLPPAQRIAPWEWRAIKRHQLSAPTDYTNETVENCIASIGQQCVAAPAARSVPAGECRIKGNISRNGRIYHVPGSSSYTATKIDETKGERWFCSDAAAVPGELTSIFRTPG